MSFTFLHIAIVFLLLNMVENARTSYCPDSVFCTQSPYYWCCPKETQCAMNMGECYSKTYMDHLLIGGGVVVGALVLICLGCMGYCIRSHLADEKKAKKINTVSEFQIKSRGQSTSRSFTNPLTTNFNVQTPTEQSSEYDKAMKYLKNTDELLQRIQQNTQTDHHL